MTSFKMDQLKKLSRIDLSPEEEENLKKSLSRVLDYMDTLNELDTTHVEPCRFVLKEMLKHQMREDVADEVLTREQFLSNTPDQIGGMIRVPPILK